MRFAEHMLLESTCHPLRGFRRIHPDDARCALGLVETRDGERPCALQPAQRLYPWIDFIYAKAPCGCGGCEEEWVARSIAHIFDAHVPKRDWRPPPGVEPWTLDRLAQWIESVDPTAGRGTRPAEETKASIRAKCAQKKSPEAVASGVREGRAENFQGGQADGGNRRGGPSDPIAAVPSARAKARALII